MNTDKKSLLDLVVVSNSLVKYVHKLDIDSKLEWTPSRNYKGKLLFPDHYAMMLTFQGIPMKESVPFPGTKTVQWNKKKKGAWEKYKAKTTNNEKLLKTTEIKSESPSKLLKKNLQ